MKNMRTKFDFYDEGNANIKEFKKFEHGCNVWLSFISSLQQFWLVCVEHINIFSNEFHGLS